MGKAILAVLCLVVGLVVGTFFGGAILTGTAAGVGVATGLSAGICSTVTAAKDEGFLTDEQIEQVLRRAATEMGGSVTEDASLVNSTDECADVLATLRAAAGT